jgi:hypothetical protein
MTHWYKIDYRPEGSDNVFTTEVTVTSRDVNGPWTATANGMTTGNSHTSLWVAIGNLMDANGLECYNMYEIDRAGNKVL